MPPVRPLRVRYACASCGATSPKWEGRCGACGDWNSLVEEVERPAPRGAGERGRIPASTALATMATDPAPRRAVGLGEVDRVLGGGVVAGALILLGGDPGIGKSTLALQIAHRCGSAQAPSLYCAGEESAAQLAMRARRLGCTDAAVRVLAETELETVIAAIESERPALSIVDSVQTLYDPALPGVPGSPSQVREAVVRLLSVSKRTGVAILLIGHVTKEGAIAGPRTLEHMVDVVLYLEGERHGEHRLLRGIKNRFGATGEVGLFTMTETGVEELSAPGRAFLDEASMGVPGNVLTVSCEGSRAVVVEVQALAAPTPFGLPRRTASGFDLGRLHLLLAVLEKRARIPFGQADVFVNAVGGVRLSEPAVDLAVALAVAGSSRDLSIPSGIAVLGEVGLGGEVRRVRRLEARLAEAEALGLDGALIPAGHDGRVPSRLVCHRAGTIADALALLRGSSEG